MSSKSILTKLYSGKLKISIKPQYVDEIPKFYTGTIQDIINTTSTNSQFRMKILADLELDLFYR